MRSGRPSSRVYPRVCGGTLVDMPRLEEIPGLSPRVRGNRPLRQHLIAVPGSIPACAGEPGSRRCRTAFAKVYPRVCGGTGP